MKNSILILALMCLLVLSCKQKDKMEDVKIEQSSVDSLYVERAFKKAVKLETFVPNKAEHDFGTISDKKAVSYKFIFTNKGSDIVVIDTVKAHCGCTTSTYTREPILPGRTGAVTVTYSPTDHEGGFRKTATLVLNGGDAYTEVRVTGKVVK